LSHIPAFTLSSVTVALAGTMAFVFGFLPNLGNYHPSQIQWMPLLSLVTLGVFGTAIDPIISIQINQRHLCPFCQFHHLHHSGGRCFLGYCRWGTISFGTRSEYCGDFGGGGAYSQKLKLKGFHGFTVKGFQGLHDLLSILKLSFKATNQPRKP